MTLIEKRPIFSMVSNIIIYLIYFHYVFQYAEDPALTADPLAFWSTVLVLMVPIMIVAKIVLYIVFSVLNSIITREMEEDHPRDEFGKQIERLATRNFYHVFIVGFLVSFGLAAMGYGVEVLFTGLFSSLITAGFVLDLSELYYQKKGI